MPEREMTTIQISKEVKSELYGLKIHSREPYNDVVERLLNFYKEKEK